MTIDHLNFLINYDFIIIFYYLTDPCEITGTSEDGQEWKHTKKCVPTDRTHYRILINGSDLVMQCSPGTAFSMETCDCTVRQIPKH